MEFLHSWPFVTMTCDFWTSGNSLEHLVTLLCRKSERCYWIRSEENSLAKKYFWEKMVSTSFFLSWLVLGFFCYHEKVFHISLLLQMFWQNVLIAFFHRQHTYSLFHAFVLSAFPKCEKLSRLRANFHLGCHLNNWWYIHHLGKFNYVMA